MATQKKFEHPVRSSLKTVSEVVAKLSDRGFCAPHIAKVNKGYGLLSYIEWHEVVRMLNEVFGPFGWDARPMGSHYYPETGVYTYDLELTGRALDDETGEVVSMTRPGEGVGVVPKSARDSESEHDRQAHGAKSDAITNASKGLGDGFGLYLYQGDDGEQKNTQSSAPRQSSGGGNRSGGNGGGKKGENVGEASSAQAFRMRENGWTDAQVRSLTRDEVRSVMDGIFGKDGAPKVAPYIGGRGAQVLDEATEQGDDFPM